MERVLLHSCCGPCSTTCIDELLALGYEVIIYYYNPNIYPIEEYVLRKNEQTRYAISKGIEVLSEDYNEGEFLSCCKGLESEKEGGRRCLECFRLRLEQTAKKAKALGFEYFSTTLTVSPHKNSKNIFKVAHKVAEEQGIKFLEKDFKKKDGYKKSIELSKAYNLYRQNYCGCRFSKKGENENNY